MKNIALQIAHYCCCKNFLISLTTCDPFLLLKCKHELVFLCIYVIFCAPQDFEKVKHAFFSFNNHFYMLMSIFALFFTFLEKYEVYFLESNIDDIGASILMSGKLWRFYW